MIKVRSFSGIYHQRELFPDGRMTKHFGQVASCAPSRGSMWVSVSTVALGIAISFGGNNAVAGGACTDIGGGNYTCVDDPGTPAGTPVSISTSGSIAVTTSPGFEVNVSGASDTAVSLRADEINFADSNAASITATGSNGRGLSAYMDNGTSISVTTSGTVSGTRQGIWARNTYGSGSVTIDAVNVNAEGGISGTAIRAENTYGGTDIAIETSGVVRGSTDGIVADIYTNSSYGGGGAITISTTDVEGTSRTGIRAYNYGGTDVSVTTSGTVRGGGSGIVGINADASGDLTITTTGEVLGGASHPAIETQTNTGRTNVVELQSGASISATSGQAIRNDGGDLAVNLRSGSAIAGTISLGDGLDAVTIEDGADISLATGLDGGDGLQDALTFSGYSGTVNGALVANWEMMNVTGSANLTLMNVDGSALTQLQVGNGSTLSLLASTAGNGTFSMSGDVINNGLISTSDGTTGDRLSFGGNLSGSGAIGLDVDLTSGTNDAVFVTGDTAGASQGLDAAVTGSTVNSAQTFTLVTVSGSSTENDFQLVNADFVTSDGAQAISDGDLAYRLDYDSTAGTFFLNPFGNSGDVTLNPGSAFYATGVEQAIDQLAFDTALRRIIAAADYGAGEPIPVSRAFKELSVANRPVTWARAESERHSYTIGNRDVTTDSRGLRFGAGSPIAEFESGLVFGGLELGIGRLASDVTVPATVANIDTNSYDLTLSALWIANEQFYVDGQLRYATFDGSIQTSGGATVGMDGSGYGVSLEIGRPFDLSNGLTLVPQAQIMYSNVEFDDADDIAGGGQTASLLNGDRLSARLGLRAEHVLKGGSFVYGQLDFLHAIDDEISVDFGTNDFVAARGDNSAALTLGGQMRLSSNAVLHAEFTGGVGTGRYADSKSFSGKFGLEISF